MMSADLKKLIASGQKKLDKLTLNLSSEAELNELKDMLSKNKIEVAELALSFASTTLVQRSALMMDFIPLLSSMSGIKRLHLKASLKNYALLELLSSNTALKLDDLELVHEFVPDQDPEAVSARVNLESYLVDYLNKNPLLKSLGIEDTRASITAVNYPKLKMALCKHPKLISFDQGFADALTNNILAKDPAVRLNLAAKKADDPRVRKIEFDKEYQRITANVMRQVETLQEEFIDYQPRHERWHLTVNLLQSCLNQFKKLNFILHGLSKELSDLEHYKKSLKTMSAYITFLKNVALIRQSIETVPHFSSFQGEIEHLWDIKRQALLKEIKLNEFSADTLNKIHSSNQHLKAMLKIVMPNRFPFSYEMITKGDDPLLQAQSLLADYTKNNSVISRFFHGHWNRHHVSEVNDIVMRIRSTGDKSINTMDDLFVALQAIDIVNPRGSLAKRIAFLEYTFDSIETPEPTPGLKI